MKLTKEQTQEIRDLQSQKNETKRVTAPNLEKILIIPGFKKEMIEIWSLRKPISPSKAGTTTSVTSSLDKKDLSGFTISILNSSLTTLRLFSFFLLFQ